MPAPLYPLFHRLEGRKVLVVGGGEVAFRKVRRLVEAGARVSVVAPSIRAELREAAPDAELLERPFTDGDIDGAVLVIAATSDAAVNRHVARLCRERMVAVNVVDGVEESDVLVPGVVRIGSIQVAISSGGESPAVVRAIRQMLEEELGPPAAEFLQIVGRIRALALERLPAEEQRRELAQKLVAGPLLSNLRHGDRRAAAALVHQLAAEYALTLPDDLLK